MTESINKYQQQLNQFKSELEFGFYDINNLNLTIVIHELYWINHCLSNGDLKIKIT